MPLLANNADSLPAINAAIAALPNLDSLPVVFPGAGYTGHQKAGALFFPSAPVNLGYLVGNEVLISGGMELGGDAGAAIQFLPGAANEAAREKFVVRVVYTSGFGQPNTTFGTDVHDLSLSVNHRRERGRERPVFRRLQRGAPFQRLL